MLSEEMIPVHVEAEQEHRSRSQHVSKIYSLVARVPAAADSVVDVIAIEILALARLQAHQVVFRFRVVVRVLDVVDRVRSASKPGLYLVVVPVPPLPVARVVVRRIRQDPPSVVYDDADRFPVRELRVFACETRSGRDDGIDGLFFTRLSVVSILFSGAGSSTHWAAPASSTRCRRNPSSYGGLESSCPDEKAPQVVITWLAVITTFDMGKSGGVAPAALGYG